MSRVPAVTRDTLAPEDQAVWDRIAGVRGGVGGPFGVLIHVPALAGRMAAVSDYFRFAGVLPAADRELVILATGREMGARYEWGRHEPRAREVGTRAEAIEAVRRGGALEELTPREQVLVELVRALLRTRALSDELFARALAELGRPQLVEVVALSGYYSALGYVLNGFEVPPPEDSPSF